MTRLSCAAALLAFTAAACGPGEPDKADEPAVSDIETTPAPADMDAAPEAAPAPALAEFRLAPEAGYNDWRAAFDALPKGEAVRADLAIPAGEDSAVRINATTGPDGAYEPFACTPETLGSIEEAGQTTFIRARLRDHVLVTRPGPNGRFPGNSLECVETGNGLVLRVEGVYSAEIDPRERVTLLRLLPETAPQG